jgi:hypothetical protein
MNEKQFKSVMANIVRENTKRLQAEAKYANVDKDLRICVYCMGTTSAYVCPECNEYKSLMPINYATEQYLGEDLLQYVE